MTRKPVRTKVAVATTAVGVAVLLAGPMNTFGLGVPTTDDVAGTTTQVTGTVQNVVDTTQQTAATTVTNVESTVQTTVQATTQAAAPQPAPATQAPSTPAATKQVTPAPVKKQTAAVVRPRTQGKPAAAPVQLAKKAGGASVAEPVRAVAVKRVTRSHVAVVSAPATPTRAEDGSAGCEVPALAALPGGAQLQALLALVCDAAGVADLPARLGLAHTDTATPAPALRDVRGTTAHGAAPARARSASRGVGPTALVGARQSAGPAVASGAGTPLGAAMGASGSGRAHGFGYTGTVAAADGSDASAASAEASKASSHRPYHSWFSGQSRGTEILMAIIFASLAIVAGIVLWRLAVRWVIPRFA